MDMNNIMITKYSDKTFSPGKLGTPCVPAMPEPRTGDPRGHFNPTSQYIGWICLGTPIKFAGYADFAA
jgi:hypothetical protein